MFLVGVATMTCYWMTSHQSGLAVAAFSTAAQLGCADMVRMLLELGVPVNATDARGWTALHAASAAGHEHVMKLLLQSGVSAHARMTSAKSPVLQHVRMSACYMLY